MLRALLERGNLNQRAMDVLEDCGDADAIAARGTPVAQMATAYYVGVAGPAPETSWTTLAGDADD